MDLRLIGQFSASVYEQYRDLLREAGIRVVIDDTEELDLRGTKIPVFKLFVAAEDFARAQALIQNS